MTLVLSVVSYAGRTPPAPLTMVFASRGGVIGRQPGCDWVLDDPEGHVSKRHGRIDYVGGQYRITDTSTNGLFLNGSGKLIGNGISTVLQDGDRLYIGRYVIDVEITAGVSETAASTIPAERPKELPARPAVPEQPSRAAAPERQTQSVPAERQIQSVPAERRGRPVPQTPVTPVLTPVPARMVASPIVAPAEEHEAAEEVTDSFSRLAEPEYDLLQLRGTRRVERGVAGGASAVDLVQAFLEGAGLSTELMNQAEPEIVLHAAGASLKALVAGLRRLVRTRRETKATLKLNGVASADNAFERAANNEAALLALLNPTGPGAPAPEVAIERGFELLEAHELALLEGARRAAAAAMAALAPETLMARIEGRSLLAASKKAKCWDLFEAEYKKLNEPCARTDDTDSSVAPVAEL
jgi:type VI secretion system FHA domain protein